MKRSLVTLGILIEFVNVAHAQSSVTLYGIIDEGLDYTNNVKGHDLLALSSGDV